MLTLSESNLGSAPLPDPDDLMQPERLATLPPTRLSASRSLLHRMSRERWSVEIVRFDIDERARGQAVYRVRTPGHVIDFLVYSFEPKLEGRTGRIIGTDWDMMGALVEGETGEEELRRTREEMPKLYAGRATPGTLVWCRSNRSLRLFEHVVARLAEGRQPDADELWRVGYLMRNTGLDGNGTFGTRSYLALEDDHPLRLPYQAQMLSAYLMREFSVDLAEHLARRAGGSTSVRLDPALRRSLGLGNGSALGLVFFANTHPALLDRWLTLRSLAVQRARALPLAPGTPEAGRATELLARAARFYEDDPSPYQDFTPASDIAKGLHVLETQLDAALCSPVPGSVYGDLLRALPPRVCTEAREVYDAVLLELRPEETDAFLQHQPVDEELRRDPAQPVGELLSRLRSEYAWAFAYDMNDPAERHYRWYKSRDAEEPRRGPAEEVPEGLEWALDLPGDIQRLAGALESVPADTLVGEFLADRPGERDTVQRVQGLAGRRYHSPHMNMLGEEFVPVHVIRLMNAAFHGLDKTADALGRSVLGLLFHGAPTRTDLAADRASDWIYPQRPTNAPRTAARDKESEQA
ncbi:hypothetical protein ACIREO_01725 [Streptomyces sp. NPDC102441]|uniref:hypothetical protein n=1 Tax=Streptomyces sp. NPDC102441 TaxID=3366176 RepID=UPI0038078A0B